MQKQQLNKVITNMPIFKSGFKLNDNEKRSLPKLLLGAGDKKKG